MKNYMVSNESIKKMSECFSDTEEVGDFFSNLDELAQDLAFLTYYRKKMANDEEGAIALVKQTVLLVSFCRKYIDLIHQLIANFDCKEINEEEFKRLKRRND